MAQKPQCCFRNRRERLLKAAKTLLAECGYEATSTSIMCRLAGTNESQLVKHFGSKQGLLEASFEYTWEQINPTLCPAKQSVFFACDGQQLL